MIVDIRIGSEFRDSIHKYSDEQLDSATVPVEIPWEPSAVTKIEKHPETKFILCVRSLREMAQAADRLSRDMNFDLVTLETGRLALSFKGERKWHDLALSLGPIGSRGLIFRIVAKAIERGNDIRGILPPVEDILFNGARPLDAEIMFQSWRLR